MPLRTDWWLTTAASAIFVLVTSAGCGDKDVEVGEFTLQTEFVGFQFDATNALNLETDGTFTGFTHRDEEPNGPCSGTASEAELNAIVDSLNASDALERADALSDGITDGIQFTVQVTQTEDGAAGCSNEFEFDVGVNRHLDELADAVMAVLDRAYDDGLCPVP